MLSICAGSVVTLVIQSPAFNAELRRENVLGQTVLQSSRDMYDRGRYLMQQATSFTRADALILGETDTEITAAPIEVAQERGIKAVALLEESLSLNPGNAQGWATMAWAQLYAGNSEEALRALRLSWKFAPNNLSLTQERIDLALILFDPLLSAEAPVYSDTDKAALSRDFTMLRVQFPQDEIARLEQDLLSVGLAIDVPEAES